MKAENEASLRKVIEELRAEVERLKAVQPTVIHYHYPSVRYWPPPQPWWMTPTVAPTTWWYIPNTTAAQSCFNIKIDSTPATTSTYVPKPSDSFTFTNRIAPFTFTNTTGGNY